MRRQTHRGRITEELFKAEYDLFVMAIWNGTPRSVRVPQIAAHSLTVMPRRGAVI